MVSNSDRAAGGPTDRLRSWSSGNPAATVMSGRRRRAGLRKFVPNGLEVGVAGPAAHLAGDDLTGPRRDDLDVVGLTEWTGHRRSCSSHSDQSAGSSSETPETSGRSHSRTCARIAAGLDATIPASIASR